MARRERRGDRGRGPQPREVLVSKKLSYILRHGAEKEGLPLGKGGYVNVQELLSCRLIKSMQVSFDEIKSLVAKNDKQRFSLIRQSYSLDSEHSAVPIATISANVASTPSADTNTDASHFLIRANQGHSIDIATDGLMTPIKLDAHNMPPICVHGTSHSAWPLIVASGGLKPMRRQHVHFATGLPHGWAPLEDDGSEETGGEREECDGSRGEKPGAVVSGMRTSSAVLIYLDLQKALEAGLPFWLSSNGVVLSEGNEHGLIPLEYFRCVEERKEGLGILMRSGNMEEDARSRWIRWSAKRGRKGT